MRNAVVGGVLVGLLSATVASSSPPPVPSYAALAAANQAAEKRVTGSDKATVDMYGTVNEVFDLGTVCGVPTYLLWLDVRTAGLSPIGVVCPGNLRSQCWPLNVGQRIRVQGVLTAVPDASDDGFEPCDRSTWQHVTPASAIAVTRVTR